MAGNEQRDPSAIREAIDKPARKSGRNFDTSPQLAEEHPWMAIDLTRYDLPAHEPTPHSANGA